MPELRPTGIMESSLGTWIEGARQGLKLTCIGIFVAITLSYSYVHFRWSRSGCAAPDFASEIGGDGFANFTQQF
jgi:hypothetical protein